MKILFYTPVSLLAGGGCERWHCDVTNSIKKQFGYDVEIISANLGQNRWKEKYLHKQLGRIKYTRLHCPTFFGVLLPTPSIFLFLLKKFKEADVIHFIHGFMGQDILIALLKFFTGKKVVVGHHAPIFHSMKIHNLYMKYVSRFILPYFDYHQTLNSQDAEFFQKKWNIKHVYFIPSGVRVEKFLEMKKVNHRKFVFVIAGRYSLQKGYDLAVKAIDRFNKKFRNNNAQFVFIGSGELESIIENYAKKNKNIKNFGYVPYEEMPMIYAKSDIYLLPSREEPFGLVLVEAWSSGLPVLATKTEGPKDMLLPGTNGWFIEEISEEGIVDGISQIYKQYLMKRDYFSSFEYNCRKTGKQFSIDTTALRMKTTFF